MVCRVSQAAWEASACKSRLTALRVSTNLAVSTSICIVDGKVAILLLLLLFAVAVAIPECPVAAAAVPDLSSRAGRILFPARRNLVKRS